MNSAQMGQIWVAIYDFATMPALGEGEAEGALPGVDNFSGDGRKS